jgi:thiamine kinase-like enzyme
VAVSPLGGGITNEKYRVDVDGETFVVRLGGRDTALLGIDRVHEWRAAATAAGLGVGPEVVWALPEAAVLVTRFVAGRPLVAEDLHEPARLGRVVAALARVHRGPTVPGTFSPFRAVEAYRDVAVRHGVRLPAGLDGWLVLGRRLEAAAGVRPAVPCHHDLLAGNFVDDGDRVWILDWEYAAMGDPWFDLGNLAANAELGPVGERRLLEAYAAECTGAGLARLGLMRVASDLREAMWGLVQTGISRLDFDFAGYAARHFARFAAHAPGALTAGGSGV